MTSAKGDELALKLARAFPRGTQITDAVRDTCALLCRNAATLHRLNEDECNGHPAQSSPNYPIARLNELQAEWDARVERGQTRAVARMTEAAAALPGRWTLDYETDPRGCSVLIYAGRRKDVHGDSWGDPKGFCIP